MDLPKKAEINKDPEWHALVMLWISLEQLERVKKKLAIKVAKLLQYQWETWSSLPRNKQKKLYENLSWIARIIIERVKWREIWEKICAAEIAAFLWRKI